MEQKRQYRRWVRMPEQKVTTYRPAIHSELARSLLIRETKPAETRAPSSFSSRSIEVGFAYYPWQTFVSTIIYSRVS